ncbi:MAG: hypothetical protein OXR66_00160 [Candidatus Woesearchaeota archaeon]|nr:hypothetical protein [Candidatus Woesearchaeota archaeon]
MRLAFILVVGLFLIACTPEGPTCTAPYIQNGNTCCLDKDEDGVCDKDVEQEAPPGMDCSLCPPKFITETEEVIVYKYVCENETIVDSPEDCGEKIVSNADLYVVNKMNDEEYIKTFNARAACRGEHVTAEVHLVFEKSPLDVVIEVKRTPSGPFEELSVLSGTNNVLDDEYYYIGLCDPIQCEGQTDAQLDIENAVVVRGKLQYAEGKIVYTSEEIIDPTPEEEYGMKEC